jgi:PAS domain S-box-containing protein
LTAIIQLRLLISEMKHLKDFIENSPDLISFYDKKLNLTKINEEALRLMKMTREETIGKNIKTLYPGIEKTGRLKDYREVIRSGKPFISDGISQTKESGKKQFSIRAFMTAEGLATVTRDTTESKKTELLLVKANQRLEELAYIAAHDMKAPLTNLQSLLQLINESDGIKDECKVLFDKVITSIERMDNTVYTLNKIIAIRESHLPNNEHLKFRAVFNNVKDSIATQIKEANVKIRADFTKAPDIFYPQLYLQSILQNLISNSIKYRNPNKQPLIEIKTLEKDDGHYLIIKDNGLGMDLDNSTDNIFRLFKRMHTHVEGSGVGLYIVNSLIESHGGSIEVTSKINKGTTFKIHFGYD